ncbi:MAG: nucleotidyl transferase AbiEii/AbiGii toxin family protein, partial [Clostridiales bacterium]|nr:nucleotidyl transferase AbiEii/AbiGii toxin family protein [Clostridiales bacterium]
KYVDNLVLKGGLLIYTLTNFESRATIDVDFLLRQLPNSVADIKIIIDEILAIPTGNDYISMEAKGYEEISPQRKYKGISTQIIGRIKNVRVPFNVDIGIGDVIIPKAEFRKISTQLPDFESPRVNTYSLESTIAEKLDAILQRFELTGRMKDFYDIYYLARTFDFDGLKLQNAIFEALQNRGTTYEKNSFERIIQLANDADMHTKWKYFLKNIKNESLDFAVVINEIKVFLEPVYEAIIKETEWQKKWNCVKTIWR